MLAKIGALVQVGSAEPNRRNVIVAPTTGLIRPLTVALSVSEPPGKILGEAVVAIVGTGSTAADTMTFSFGALQGAATAALFASPL